MFTPRPTTTTHPTTTTTTAASAGTERCTSDPSGDLPGNRAYDYAGIVNSNGYNTYVDNNMWAANSGSTQTVCGTSPGDWAATADMQPSGYTGVQTYPNVQQLFDDWTGSGWNGSGAATETPMSALSSLTSTYTIVDPPEATGDWEAAYDIWTSAGELMIWVDTSTERLQDNGSAVVDRSVAIDGQSYTYMNYGGRLPIMVLNTDESSGTIDVLDVLKYWQSTGVIPADTTIGQLDFGWEICNTAGRQLTFQVTNYTISSSLRR